MSIHFRYYVLPYKKRTAMAATTCRRDVTTELVYWKPAPGKVISTDFTTPGGEERFNALESLRTTHPVTIHDIRGQENDFTLDRNGFQYIHHEVPGLKDCSNEDLVAALLIPETETLVQKLTGATKTIVFAHRIRCKATDTAKRGDSRAPAYIVHSDFTVPGALHHLEVNVKDQAEREQLTKGRFCIINVWRPLKTITRDPLTVCDWTSVDPETDWMVNRLIFPHGRNEFGSVVYNDKHKWFYLSHQEPSEPLVFKQFDSKETGNGGVTLAHCAFIDPEYANAKARESIEIKMFAFMPEGDS
ncbi:hypothetical protein DTO166G4_2598 [Paecilomyces variotii]|nr:hypothetical protein DTO164E3_5970 [Paecilomyces variotii]KAJ9197825.1 hypothetical protein DTO032I3_5782 [Paecilomyces variotii]KAJ9215761.1 hypothetical protein DTO166G4_2598 [Paecilomyces variotii]KAJ9219146.1 hypothetical protein DTO169C6_8530 [Paecilomyces variotii]KAJ9229003.1 hypothetical protein DTO169E5_8992 [Paecilomyces variotii]